MSRLDYFTTTSVSKKAALGNPSTVKEEGSQVALWVFLAYRQIEHTCIII